MSYPYSPPRHAGRRLALTLLLVAAAVFTTPAPATTAGTRAPAASIVVDADTGAVVLATNARARLRPASTTKVLTALVAVDKLPADARVPVSARAAGMPASLVGMKTGQVWSLKDTMHALLMVSANDAAVAVAERTSGSLEAFDADLDRMAERLHLSDRPVLHDPSGFDDRVAVAGGNFISARDLAITARALLRAPALDDIVAEREYGFTDPAGVERTLVNHNKLLRRYEGCIGVKTGFTDEAGHTLISAARREGRTMVAVVLDAPDLYGSSQRLLDRGFATPVSRQRGLDHLPAPPRLGPGALVASSGTSGARRGAFVALAAIGLAIGFGVVARLTARRRGRSGPAPRRSA